MNFTRYLIVFGLFLCFNAQAKVFDAAEHYLDNGLRVIVAENHKAPVAKVMLWYQVGSINEEIDKSGLAHLLEHLMFRGTRSVPADKFNALMNGVEYNAFTNTDFTVYHATTDISRLELVLAVEADRMTNLNISDEAFLSERKIVFEERQQRIDNKPRALFAEEINQILWQKTPYEHPVAGWATDIKALTKSDALDFYRRFYAPDNAVLVIVGDITPQIGFELAQKYFGAIHKRSAIKTNPETDFYISEEQKQYFVTRKLANVQTPQIAWQCLVSSVKHNKRQAYALTVFSSYFGEGKNAYLERELVEKHRVIAAGSSVGIYHRGLGTFVASFIPLTVENLTGKIDVLPGAMRAALDNLTPEMLEKEKKKILSWFVYTKDNPEDLAYLLGLMASLGLSMDDIENHEQRLKDVTLDDVRDAMLSVLNKTKCVTAISMPKEDE